MNSYEQRQEARRQRLENAADRADTAASATLNSARKMASAIPFGQPILVGHHSEGRDRRYRARIHNTQRKGFNLMDKAAYLRRKAAGVGLGGISSDDPAAIKKLRDELANMEASQERMKAANKAIRTHKNPEARTAALVAQGFSEAQAAEMLKPDFAGRVGFADYSLKNNNANIRRVKGRIAELEQRRQREAVQKQGEGYTYREDTDENRVMFEFDRKPNDAARDFMKKHGFRWSPSRGTAGAWVRMLNGSGIYWGKVVREWLDANGF